MKLGKKLCMLSLGFCCLAGALQARTVQQRQDHTNQAITIRSNEANALPEGDFEEQLNNGDEGRYTDHRGSFAKVLDHEDFGTVKESAFQSLITALNSGDQEDFDNIELGVGRRLVSPHAAFDYSMVGADGWFHTMPAAPAFASAEAAAEMVELYWSVLVRDVPFNKYATNNTVSQAVADLNNMSNFTGPKENDLVTIQTFLRGQTPGDLKGPYISQFLYQAIPYHDSFKEIKRFVPTSGTRNDFMTTYADWFTVQNGGATNDTIKYTTQKKYIRNARDLGDFVHGDFPFEAYENAALILLGYGDNALDDNNPFKTSTTQEGFATFGMGEILKMVAEVSQEALKAAWYHKWLIHRRSRPEYFGFMLHQQLTTPNLDNEIHEDLVNSAALPKIKAKYGSYFLPQQYPEGSPAHPAYPAGHATMAGACVTVLKAFFKEDFVIPNALVLNNNNTKLVLAHEQLTVGDELNKLASNISLGRDHAGVHYRTDGDQGILLGEKIAISYLNYIAKSRFRNFVGFSLTKFDGTQITVGQNLRVDDVNLDDDFQFIIP